MALVLADRVRDTTTTTGTGTVTLSGTAPTGYQNFSVIGNANTTYYTINSDTQWEVGVGTYTSSGTTLARNTVLASSNGGALVDFAAGTKDVFVTYPSEKAVTEDYGNALAATTAANLAGGAAGSIPYQTAANTTAMLATGTGVLIGGTTPSYTMSPSLTQVTVAGDPSTAFQVATKQYVDTQTSAGIHYHEPVRVESPLNLNATYNNGTAGVGATLTNAGTQAALVIDGVTVIVADRVLIYQQTNPVQNGIYVVTNVGSGSTNWVLTRSSDADTYVNASPDGLSEGSTVFVQQGTTGAGTTYTCNTTGTITFGTTAITFVEISSAQIYSAGTGLTLTGTTFSLTAPVATSLGGTGLTTFTSGGAVYATSASVLTTGTLPATAGGTGQSSYTTGDLLYAASATTIGVIADVATGNALISGGAGGDPSYGKIGLTTHISGTLAVGNGGTGATTLTGYLVGNGTSAFTATATIPTSALSGTISLTTQVSGTLGAGNGGTGISSYTVGDILYASGTTTLASLADVATGNALISGGVSNAPLWGKIGLTTHVSGTLPVANGGSGATTLTGYLKGNGTSAFTASATIPSGDITGAALTEFDDTNVTMTLGGSPSTALLAATSMTLGWTGQLAVSRGGTGNSTLTSNYLLKGNGVSPVAASVIYDDGTNVFVGGTTGGGKFNVKEGATNFEVNTSGTSADLLAYDRGASAYKLLKFRGSEFTFNPGDVEKVRIDTVGNLGLNTATPVGRLSVVSGSSTGASTSAWSGNYSVFGPNAGSATGAAIALGYNTSADAAEIIALAPSVAWKPLNLYSAGLNLYASSGAIGASLNGSGTFSAVTDIRAPIFYDSANTAYYVDPATNSVLNGSVSAVNFAASNAFYVNGFTYYLNSTGGGWYSNARIQSEVDMRAPIFYDFNNTGYYVDPASTSNLVGLTVANTITGNAATATNLSTVRTNWSTNGTITAVVGQLAWKNYGNNHTIFDASNSSSPDGGAVNNTNAQVAWAGTYPTLMGWNGVNTYGVRVDSARVADSASAVDFNNLTNKTGGTGTYTTSGDFRAPIFYDSDNSAYYIDPASTSVLNVMRANTLQFSSGNQAADLNNASYFILRDPTANPAIYLGGADPANYYDNTTHWFRTRAGGNMAIINSSGLQAPIFYDISNTAYYGDFAGTSNIFNLTISGTGNKYLVIQSTDSGEAMVRYLGATGPSWYVGKRTTSQVVDTASFHFYSESAGATVGGIDVSGNMLASGSMRAPIFYDLNNTGYYVDPASDSTLANVVMASTIDSSLYYDSALEIRERSFGGALTTSFNNAPRLTFHWGGRVAMQLALGSDNILNVMNGDCSGFTTFRAGDVYGNVFYDRENTAYYVDPASTSVLNTVQYGINYTSGGGGGRIIPSTGSPYSLRQEFGSDNTGWRYGIAKNVAGTVTIQFFVSDSGIAEAVGDMRAPIFYDSNNTGYYLDPASTGTSLNVAGNIIGVGELRTSGQITNANYMVGGSQNGAVNIGRNDLNYRWEGTNWGSTTTLGLLANCLDYWEFGIHDSGSKVVSPLYYDGGARFLMGRDIGWGTTYIEAASNFRATLFYDSNDTGFYVDPATTSVLNQAQFKNRIAIGDGNGTPFLNAGSPGVWLSYNGGVDIFMGSESSTVAGFYIAGAWRFRVNSSGDATATGNVTAYSDARIKKDVTTIDGALDLVSKMRGVRYTRIDTEKPGTGVIAQEMLEVMPEVVQQGVGDDDTLSVAYGNLVGVLIEAIKELTARVAELEGK